MTIPLFLQRSRESNYTIKEVDVNLKDYFNARFESYQGRCAEILQIRKMHFKV